MRVIGAITGEIPEMFYQIPDPSPSKRSPKKSNKSPKKSGKTPKSRKRDYMNNSSYSANINNADVHDTFGQTASDARKETEESKSNSKFKSSKNYDDLDYDWKLYKKDSPVRRRVAHEKSPSRYGHTNLNRNTAVGQSNPLDSKRDNPMYNSYSHGFQSQPMQTHPHQQSSKNVEKPLPNIRETSKNRDQPKSRVDDHWSPKRREQMRDADDKSTEYYTERFIKDVLKDVQENNLTIQEGKDYLKEFSYDLEVRKDPAGFTEYSAVKISEAEVASPSPSPERAHPQQEFGKLESGVKNDENILRKELAIGKDLLKNASLGISEESLLDLSSDNHLTVDDQEVIKVFMGLLELVNHGKQMHYPSWSRIQSELGFTSDWLHRIDEFERMIEHYTYPKFKLDDLKRTFTKHAQFSSNKEYVTNVREFM